MSASIVMKDERGRRWGVTWWRRLIVRLRREVASLGRPTAGELEEDWGYTREEAMREVRRWLKR